MRKSLGNRMVYCQATLPEFAENGQSNESRIFPLDSVSYVLAIIVANTSSLGYSHVPIVR